MKEKKERKIEVSVIVPVYNTGFDLKEALTSISSQTFEDYEILCIDDCSNDNETIRILADYEESDNRIKVLRQSEHIGAAKCRNNGLKEAVGSYIIFLDADDIFAHDLLEKMYKTVIAEDADMCICLSQWMYQDGRIELSEPQRPKVNAEDWLIGLSYVPWDKMVKRSVLEKYKIQFQDLTSSNDVFYSMSLYICLEKIAWYTDHPLVTYRYGTGNQISSRRDARNIYKVSSFVWNRYRHNKKLDVSMIALFMIFYLISEFKRCKNEVWKKEAYNKARSFLIENELDIVYTDSFNEFLFKRMLLEEYESKWYDKAFTIESKLKAYMLQIISVVSGYNAITLWGMGERGRTFFEIAKEKFLKIDYITDRKLILQKQKKYFGISVIEEQEALTKSDLIIASNHSIAEYVKRLNSKVDVVDIEDYA